MELKQACIIRIMTENANRPRSEVLKLIVAEPRLQMGSSVDLGRAKAYYGWISRKGLAPGESEASMTIEDEIALAEEAAIYLSRLGKRRVPYNGRHR